MIISTLPNGIRVVHIQAPGPAARCALVINAGSRDECDSEHGLAHFVEHTIFKGTTKRRARHILSRLDEVGGELNAYTTKDETAIHAAFLEGDLERAVDLIADMAFNSTFPDAELDKEREVIIDEITSYEDSPSELIFDEFEDLAYEHTPLGHNILGNPDSVSSFTADDARRFICRNHSTSRMAFAYVGPHDVRKVMRVAEKYLGSCPERNAGHSRVKIEGFRHFEIERQRQTSQAHVVLGCDAPHCFDDDRVEMNLIANILGGPSMNSTLSVALREKNGIAYNVETNYTSFDDAGLFTIYFGTDRQNVARSLRIVRKELDKLCQEPLSEVRFAKVVRQYVNQILMSADDAEALMLAAGRSAILYSEVLSVYQIADLVRQKVTRESLLSVAQRILPAHKFSRLAYV